MPEMNRKQLLLNITTLLFLIFTYSKPLGAATSGESCGPLEIYDYVLSKHVPEKDAAGATEIVVLRYLPGDTSIEREYRIVVVTNVSGRIRAWRTDADGTSIQSQRRNLLETDQLSCDQIAARIKLASAEFDDQRILKRILRDFGRLRLSTRLASEFYLDAPQYEITTEAGMNAVSWQLSGPRDSPLIAWFKRTSAALSAGNASSTRP